FDLNAVLPPPNDNFASAMNITTIPFTGNLDTSAATVEPGEPAVCDFVQSSQTAWYTYTPATTGSLSASTSGFNSPGIAIYTGDSLGNLTRVACGSIQAVTVRFNAGTTYHIQVGAQGQSGGPLQFNLVVPPPPSANMFFSPNEPTTFDDVQ